MLNEDGDLQTDLFVKPTDSRAYLYYGSTHPNHIYSSIVYSKFLRLRRIINDDERLSRRIDELKEYFYNSNFPRKMVENISSKVKLFERRLPTCKNMSNSSILIPASPDDKKIRVVSTYGSNNALLEIVEKFEPTLETSPSLSSSTCRFNAKASSTPSEQPNKKRDDRLLDYVNRTGPSLRRKLVNSRQHAHVNTHTKTMST